MEQWIYEAILAVVKEPTKENARIVATTILSEIISEQEARDLLSAINCYLLCDFGVQDVEMQAQAAAEKERILKIQEKLKKIIEVE